MVFNIFNFISAYIGLHPFSISFISGFLSEELVIFLAILSGRGIISPWLVLIFGFLGAFIGNTIMFFLGKSKFGNKIYSWFIRHKHHGKAESELLHINKKRHILYLTASKFVFGTRAASAVYYGIKGMKIRNFLFYNSIATAIWAIVFVTVGYFAGEGFTYLLKFTRGFERFMGLIFLTLILIYLIYHIISKIIVKESKHLLS